MLKGRWLIMVARGESVAATRCPNALRRHHNLSYLEHFPCRPSNSILFHLILSILFSPISSHLIASDHFPSFPRFLPSHSSHLIAILPSFHREFNLTHTTFYHNSIPHYTPPRPILLSPAEHAMLCVENGQVLMNNDFHFGPSGRS